MAKGKKKKGEVEGKREGGMEDRRREETKDSNSINMCGGILILILILILNLIDRVMLQK